MQIIVASSGLNRACLSYICIILSGFIFITDTKLKGKKNQTIQNDYVC